MSNTIFLIRHGETTWNRIGRLQGQADSPLTLRGTQQAEAIGQSLNKCLNNKKYLFWCSPLGRTRQTAAIICDIIGFDYEAITFDKRLKEITLGARDGYRSWQALMDDFPEEMKTRAKDPWNFSHPNGESSQMVKERLEPFLEQIEKKEGTHVIVSHGVVSKIMRGIYLNLSTTKTFALDRPQDAFHRLRDGFIKKIELDVK